MKSFVLIEQGNSEASMVGVVAHVRSLFSFKSKFIEAVEAHFDAEIEMKNLPDVFDGGYEYEIIVETEGVQYTIDVILTWIY